MNLIVKLKIKILMNNILAKYVSTSKRFAAKWALSD